jgi:1,4-alpha-glucan branching enzyme
MAKLRTAVSFLLAIVATSYVTLGIAATHTARLVWAPYAATVMVLATANLWLEHRDR